MAEKILIVDDDVETLRLVGLMLQRQGYEILAAENGTQAITSAKKENPDLIVLDVMMPDMDGYQVTHELRKNPGTALTPILMFTAKSQVDDKVAGYDAGVDDYLTKPVHPAELVAHIKALLSRTRARPVAEEPQQKAFMVGVLGCRGGLGTSTLTLNLAASYSQQNRGTAVTAAEIRPGLGSWGIELGFNNPDGLRSIIQSKASDINAEMIERVLVTTNFSVKLLLASMFNSKLDYSALSDTLPATVRALSHLNGIVFVDIGTHLIPGFEKIVENLDEVLILTEPNLITVKRTKILIEQMRTANLLAGKSMDLVLYNHMRADIQMNSSQVSEEMEGTPVSIMIPPSPELAIQAGQRHTPMINLQPESLIAQQFARLAEIIHERFEQSK